MTVRAALAAAAATALLLTAVACSPSGGPAPTPSPAASTSAVPSGSASAGPATPTPSGLSTVSTEDLEVCMSGDYRLARFITLSDSSNYGTGEGGDLKLHIDKGDWTLTGAGKDPVKLTLAGQTGDLLVNGTIVGKLRTDNYSGTFAVTSADGSATLGDQTISMQQVATIIAPKGSALLVCNPGSLTMLFDGLRLDFER